VLFNSCSHLTFDEGKFLHRDKFQKVLAGYLRHPWSYERLHQTREETRDCELSVPFSIFRFAAENVKAHCALPVIVHVAAEDVDVITERFGKQVKYGRIRGIRFWNDEFADKWEMGHCSIIREYDEVPFVHVVNVWP
jgi:hypothetical protein